MTRGDLEMFLRFAGGIRRYLKHRLTRQECLDIVAAAEQARESNFLLLLRQAVYDNPRSPYLRLLAHAGARYGDIESDVLANGVESAAARLYEAGVYVDFEEFKGKKRIERPGLSFSVRAEDFDNPILTRDFEVMSGGSMGARRRMAVDLELLTYEAALRRLFYEAAGVLDRPHAIWRPVPPGSSGIKHALRTAKFGRPLERWFSPAAKQWSRGMWPSAVLTSLTVAAGRTVGGVIPPPEHVPLDAPAPVAQWAAAHVRSGRPPLLSLPAGSAVRVASEGLGLEGTVLELGGEAITQAKVDRLQACGATTLNGYSLSETGPLGVGCLNRTEIDEIHFIRAKTAIHQQEVTAPDGSLVRSLLITTTHPSTPKLLLNVDIGDYGVIPTGSCGCDMEGLGFTHRLHTIRSYEKMTAGGMHFTGGDVHTILEDVLPNRHGGAPGDYQFLEEEREGLSHIGLVVSPRVELRNAELLTATVLEFLSADSRGGSMMAEQWRQAKTLEVLRREPYTTSAGKTPPIRVMPR